MRWRFSLDAFEGNVYTALKGNGCS